LVYANSFAFYSIFHEMPSLILRLRAWDIVGSVAYTLMFALFESLVFCVVFSVAATLIPFPRGENRFVFRGVGFFLITLFGVLMATAGSTEDMLRSGVGMVATALLFYLFLRRDPWVRAVSGFVDRITVLGGLYLFMDAVSVVIVIIRNVF
jgi:hypothetical protein